MNIQISKDEAVTVLSASWQTLISATRTIVASDVNALNSLAQEMLPHIVNLTQQSLSDDPAVSAPAKAALSEAGEIAKNEAARLGYVTIAAESVALEQGIQFAATWLGVLLKAVVL